MHYEDAWYEGWHAEDYPMYAEDLASARTHVPEPTDPVRDWWDPYGYETNTWETFYGDAEMTVEAISNSFDPTICVDPTYEWTSNDKDLEFAQDTGFASPALAETATDQDSWWWLASASDEHTSNDAWTDPAMDQETWWGEKTEGCPETWGDLQGWDEPMDPATYQEPWWDESLGEVGAYEDWGDQALDPSHFQVPPQEETTRTTDVAEGLSSEVKKSYSCNTSDAHVPLKPASTKKKIPNSHFKFLQELELCCDMIEKAEANPYEPQDRTLDL